MSLRVWSTRDPGDASFDTAWDRRLAAAPHANFSMGLAYQRWEAQRGSHARAVLLDDGQRAAAVILRETQNGLTSGWPWRWQSALEGADPSIPGGMSAEDAHWLFTGIRDLPRQGLVKLYLPANSWGGAPGHPAGRTILYSVDHGDEELLAAMAPSKRRMIRRACARGYEVIETTCEAELKAFARVQRESKARHGMSSVLPQECPAPGEGWREWELPWMWLLLAVREGKVESGIGDGILAHGVIEGRAAGSTAIALKDGAFAMLSFEEARRARDRGSRWINLGGNSLFKRELTGSLGRTVTMGCWLSGPSPWEVTARLESAKARLHTGWASLRGRLREAGL